MRWRAVPSRQRKDGFPTEIRKYKQDCKERQWLRQPPRLEWVPYPITNLKVEVRTSREARLADVAYCLAPRHCLTVEGGDFGHV